ncbi:Adenylate cyclase [Psilocybe cubensis]|uniref:Adenylate cyclase n=2 Tax=Psilocybe cubensis TaxID=181762 RepID=A0A8H8CNX3_PSICU|nr:Adenylate cyclase [Psilocybe cubensis]KAH9484853.1 Adenylate cyclase [Psilocybe cubensis]
MDRRQSTIRLSDDAVDQNGVARFADYSFQRPMNDDSIIAPWIDEPPTPPPKNSKSFGFSQKSSLVSFASLRQNSTTSLLRSIRPSESSLYIPETNKRRSQDDSESAKGMLYSGSSAHSGDLRKAKSNLNLFQKLRTRSSKPHLRSESDGSEHPSLKAPVPPLPDQRHGNNLFNGLPLPMPVASTSTIPIQTQPKKGKPKKRGKEPPTPPPKNEGQEFTGDLDLRSMEGILDPKVLSAGTSSSMFGNPSSPSSGSQSHSEHSSQNNQFEFNDPFSPTSLQDKRKAIIPKGDYRKVSPMTIMPPSDSCLPVSSASSTTLGPGSPTGSHNEGWVPPESWAVKGTEDPYDNPHTSGNLDSSDSDNSSNGLPPALSGKKILRDKTKGGRRRNASGSSVSLLSTTSKGSRSTIRGNAYQSMPFKVRFSKAGNNATHIISADMVTTVADLTAKLSKRLPPGENHLQHNLYLSINDRERILAPNERPGVIVKQTMEQAGYDFEDGHHLLGVDSLNNLLKFVYKSQLLAGEEKIVLDNYDMVDLSGRGLRTIPVVLHQNADSIVTLRLDGNPMLEIPLDFIQSCTILRDLNLTQMSMKKVPASLRHSTSLHRLNLSSNCIRDLEDACLDHIEGLIFLGLMNNRLDVLPSYFPNLRALNTLNISNNKFRELPLVVTQLENLHDLDISFNPITELPDEIGRLTMLERLIMVGNRIVKFPPKAINLHNLRILDCRRNQISDLSVICMLPNLTELSADHNVVHALELALGPRLTTLNVSHNDITQLSLVPGPMGRPYGLTLLDLSYAKLSSLDDLALGQLTSLRTLKLDHNSIRSIPDSLGDLIWLEYLSCTDNKLDALPATLGKLQKLECLDAHNNSLTELPQTIWSCASLSKINVTSNFINGWHDPPVPIHEIPILDGSLAAPGAVGRKSSTASIGLGGTVPSLVYSLSELYLGENCLTDGLIQPLMVFSQLKTLNLSFNQIQDLPSNFFRNMLNLEELYLSGNKLTSLPVEDFHRLVKLTTIYINGNRLHTLPQELGKVKGLQVLDAGSNLLRYNINNWEFDWNWNFNTNLRYLNLSGNKRLQIKAENRPTRYSTSHSGVMLSGFTSLTQLKVLGLMDVTITTTGKDTTVDIPDENSDRRIRTSLSTVCGMGYGIADSLGKDGHLNMIDLVHEFTGSKHEAIFAMFGRTHYSKTLKPGSTPNRLAKFLHDNFVNVFKTQMGVINTKLGKDGVPPAQWKEGVPKALHWTFLKLNQDLRESLAANPRKNSQASVQAPDQQYNRMGASGIVVYFLDHTIYAANVGDSLAVVSRQGVCHQISRKHDPYDRDEIARIRAAEGFMTPAGLVNEEVDVSRSFGYFHFFPPLHARPDIFTYDLTEMDEFVIIANRGLWDFVPYQTAVDIARTVARNDKPDPMLAAQKLRDFAISYGADGNTMIMVIWVADLFNSLSRSRQPTLDPVPPYYSKRKNDIRDHGINRLREEVPAPVGHITIVFTDIRNSTHLWEANPGMPTAMRLHNNILRRQLRFCGGYEVKTEGDSFMCSFPTTLAAVWWCLSVQVHLLHESWPLEILECEDGKPIYNPQGHLIACGLSVRMGIHSGTPLCEPDIITQRMDYFGPMVNRSARINSSALGGQILCSLDIVREINAKILEVDEETEYSKLQSPEAIEAIRRLGVVIIPVGEVKLKGIELPENLSILYPAGLEGRHELKEASSNPTASGSRVPFSVPQIRDLGLLCLRFEALSTGRVFKPLPDRKRSIQSNPDADDSSTTSMILYGDPNLLLPSINEHSSDSDLMLVLDALTIRINNAANTVYQQFRMSTMRDEPPSQTKNSLMSALEQDGILSPDIVAYIASKM